VWRAPLSPAATDVSADILSLVIDTLPERARLTLELSNDQGQYSSADFLGQQVNVSLGYKTTQGDEASSGLAYWVYAQEKTSLGGKASLILHAGDPGDLGGIKFSRQYVWAQGSKSISLILRYLLARAGIRRSVLSQSSLFQTFPPAFIVHPNERGETPIRRLLSLCPDVLFFRGARAYTKYPQSTDAVDYSYGDDHPILEARYITRSWEVNRAQVYGDGVMAQDQEWQEIERVYSRLSQVYDRNITTATQASDRASGELREAEIAAGGGYIVVPLNCGQELWDVVQITDARAGLSQVKKRVVSLRHSYIPAKGEYKLRIGLGEV
jgi:hypothetical protein